MYIWILQAALNALWLVFNKKIVSNTNIWNHLQIFFMRFVHIFILIILVWFGFLNFSIPTSLLTPLNLAIVLLWTFSLYFTYLLRNVAYRNEKVSTLQPFAMLYQVLPPLISFIFIASEKNSPITFLASLFASIIIIYSSINFKTFTINKYSGMVLLSSIIKSVQMFYMIYLIQFLSQSTFYILESIFVVLIACFFSFRKNEFVWTKYYSWKYLITAFFWQAVILSSIVLSLTMFKTFWVILTSLIGLLYLVFAFLFSYIFLKESPWKKDVIVTSLVSVCIIIWVLFR